MLNFNAWSSKDFFCVCFQDLANNLSGIRQNLEDTAFDVQNFISEHAQFLNPAQNRQMLKSLSATQRAFKQLMDRVVTQRHTLDLQLEIHEDEIHQQVWMTPNPCGVHRNVLSCVGNYMLLL